MTDMKKTEVKPNDEKDIEIYKIENYKSSNTKVIKSLITYVVIFVIIIPYLLSINGHYGILKYYMPNVDMIATLVSYKGGIFKNKLFSNLYDKTPTTYVSQLSKVIINYCALLGLTYIIAKETYVNNSISAGWSLGFIMLLTTYLLPNNFINDSMEKFNNYFYEKTENENKSYNLAFIAGFCIILFIIFFERTMITYFRESLIYIADFLKSF